MPTAGCLAVQELLRVIGDIDRLDLVGATRTALIQQLTQKVVERTHVPSIEVVVSDTPDGGLLPGPSADVSLIRQPGNTAELVPHGGGWWGGHLATIPVVGAEPQEFERDADGQRELVVVLRLATCYGAARVILPEESRDYSKLWATGLVALFQTLSTRRHECRRGQRQAFFNGLVEPAGTLPEDAFVHVAREWHRLGQPKFTWLWLRNPYTNRFEAAGQMGNPIGDFEPDDTSASAYAIRTGEPVVIRGDLTAWQAQHAGVHYRVAEAARVRDTHGTRSLIVVPFQWPITPSPAPAPGEPTVTGPVALHYDDPHATPPQRKDSLLLMARHTAQVVVNAFRDEQRRLLVDLNEMAQRHLTQVSRRPVSVRAEYLKELVELIQKKVGFRTVSIFYRRPFDEAIACVGTSGIAHPDFTRIAADRLSEVVYQRYEGRTGDCLANGKVRLYDPKTDTQPRQPRSLDLDPGTGAEVQGSVFVPILRHEPKAAFPQVLGVIRCGQFERFAPNGGAMTIHPIQVQNLQYIAQQVGPMLQILENSIRRERTISTTKHDLFTQMNMIRDAVDLLTRDIEAKNPPREYALKNLGVARIQGTHLIAQLDPEPESQQPFEPEPTLIEGHILARVVSLLRHYAASYRKMTIEYDVRAIPRLYLDRALVERAIHNLIVNAVKYGAEGTAIHVTGRTARNGFMLDVSNEGIGIDDADAKLIGEPNFRADKTKHLAQGVGLGVYIARTAMRRIGGDLYLTNKRNPTTFSLFFPRRLHV